MLVKDLPIISVKDSEEAGLIVWWRLSGDVQCSELGRCLSDRNVPINTPPLPSEKEALRRAAVVQQGRDLLVRPLKKGGFAFVVESSDETGTLSHYVEGTVITKESVAIINPSDLPYADDVLDRYSRNLESYSATDISKWLANSVEELSGFPLRDRGGIYFIPSVKSQAWRSLAEAVSEASCHTFFSVPAMRTEEAVEAILSALETYAEKTIVGIESEIERLGHTALSSRKRQVAELEKDLQQYEGLLGSKLGVIRSRLQSTKALVSQELLLKIENA